ncbi:MAG: Hsp20/alpha crystallin family protein [Bacteroidetes bacterium]|nr:MAG: Hsp20/alpha crystallin family protein [Bacteroidota bacterium]
MSNSSQSDDMFQQLRDGFSELGKKVSGFMDDVFSGEGGDLRVATDIYLAPGEYIIQMELPGVQKGDVSIQIHDGILLVKGAKHRPEGAETFPYERQERRFGQFQRSFPLPVSVEMEGIKAKYDAGLLTIRFPRHADQEDDRSSEIHID